MALVASNLHKVAGGAKALFMYETPDAIATVIASGYFNAVSPRLKQYDNILVTFLTGGATSTGLVAVTSLTDAAVVTVSANT